MRGRPSIWIKALGQMQVKVQARRAIGCIRRRRSLYGRLKWDPGTVIQCRKLGGLCIGNPLRMLPRRRAHCRDLRPPALGWVGQQRNHISRRIRTRRSTFVPALTIVASVSGNPPHKQPRAVHRCASTDTTERCRHAVIGAAPDVKVDVNRKGLTADKPKLGWHARRRLQIVDRVTIQYAFVEKYVCIDHYPTYLRLRRTSDLVFKLQ
jgi:hypothetical protein